MPTQTTAQTKAKTKTKAQLETERRDREARAEHNKGKRRELKALIRETTQGEWLAVCRGLSLTREQVQGDEDLLLLAMAWVRDKRKHGSASWDVLLELTDRGVLEFHGFQLAPIDDDDDDAEPEPDNEG